MTDILLIEITIRYGAGMTMIEASYAIDAAPADTGKERHERMLRETLEQVELLRQAS